MVITAEQRAAISDAVAEAERGTSGEIVPVVAEQSGRYDRSEDLFGVFVALVALAIVWLNRQAVRIEPGDWSERFVPAVGLISMLLTVLVGFLGGAFLASRFPALRRVLIPKGQIRDEVERSAAAAFHRFRVRRTREATGILLYVSVYERMVLVLGDDAVAAVLSQDDWDRVRDLVLDGARAGDLASGLTAGVRAAGDLLRQHFPAEGDDENELHNGLRVV